MITWASSSESKRNAEHRAQYERELVQELDADPRYRQGRLRDVVNAQEMSNELMSMLSNTAAEVNSSIPDLLEIQDPPSREDRPKLRDISDRCRQLESQCR